MIIESNDKTIISLERADAVLACLLDDGVFSWSSGHFDAEGWHDVIVSFDHNCELLQIIRDYIYTALDTARQTEKGLLSLKGQ